MLLRNKFPNCAEKKASVAKCIFCILQRPRLSRQWSLPLRILAPVSYTHLDVYKRQGLGSAVCEVSAGIGKGRVKRVGIQDCFGQSAPYERLLAMNGITVENIVELAEKW